MSTDLFLLLLYWRKRRSSYNIRFYPTEDDDDFLLALLIASKKKFCHSRNRKRFYQALSSSQQRMRVRRIPRPCLLPPDQSPWKKLYIGKDDSAMISLTGLSKDVFEELHEKFLPFFQHLSPHSPSGMIEEKTKKSGRKRIIKSKDCLALTLAWTRTRGSLYILSMIFGLSHTSVSCYLRFGRRILVEILQKDKDAKVIVPSDEKIQEFKAAVANRHPNLIDVWATMDGLKLTIERSPLAIGQNRYYNGWTHGPYITNVLVFCPYEEIPIACCNVTPIFLGLR